MNGRGFQLGTLRINGGKGILVGGGRGGEEGGREGGGEEGGREGGRVGRRGEGRGSCYIWFQMASELSMPEEYDNDSTGTRTGEH